MMKAVVVLAGVFLAIGLSAAKAGDSLPQASFDCAKAATSVEKWICGNPQLAEADRNIAQLYGKLISGAQADTAETIKDEQRAWLKGRSSCEVYKAADEAQACLGKQMAARIASLGDESKNLAFDMIVASIPSDPKGAADKLRTLGDDGRAAGWLAYLARFEPASGVTREEGDRALDRAVASLQTGQELLTDKDDPHKDAGLLMLLRLLIQNSRDTMVMDCPQSFLFKQHPDLAYEAFGELWGSSMDSGAPYCSPRDELFTQPAWKTISDAFSTPQQVLGSDAGSMVHGHYAAIATNELHMSIQPQDFAANGPDKLKKVIARINKWKDAKVWSKSDRTRLLAAIPRAEAQTAQWLVDKRGFSRDAAAKASVGIVASYLDDWTGWVEDPEGGG
ncbi:lysozyme inhibitor LprI family protein [Labrys okinawensis]|uniref:lysozyme inhibitor LprI family protein n=1 Tax=Labrys okinawensis TaxID=346911 RepID=UPI0039BD0D00